MTHRSNPRTILAVLAFLMAALAFPEPSLAGSDPLSIDGDGTVDIGTSLKVNGPVRAPSFEGDGSQLRLERIDGAIEKKFDKSGGLVDGPVEIRGPLQVEGVVRAGTFESTNPNTHRMYPEDAKVYQDIFDALNDGTISRMGNPAYNDTSYRQVEWFGRKLIQFGGNNEADGNGAMVIVPPGCETVWVRFCGNRWNAVHAYFLDGAREDLGIWIAGFRYHNTYCPDGSLSDGTRYYHQWLPIPVGRSGKLALVSKSGTNDLFWVSGLAFSRNPWAHAAEPAVAYHWASNGGNPAVWGGYWNDEVLAFLQAKSTLELKVPVIPTGRDKLLYLIQHNDFWNGCSHTGIRVNGQPIERFLATYDNPFARHWNSKYFERYIAARIPAALIPKDARWLTVIIDMSRQVELNADVLFFREIGTHDLEVPRGN
jgi:hypothetical protein